MTRPPPHTVGVITTSRADYGIYRSVLNRLEADTDFELGLWVTGMHLSPEFGMTVRLIENDGRRIIERIDGLISADSEEAVAASMGLTTLRFASALARHRPDLLIVLGDRFEMHAAALAAVPLRLPLAHIHGGEETENAIDNVFRHSLTKLSHLHFTSTKLAKARVLAMGEPPEAVIVSGAPALDGVGELDLLDHHQLASQFNLPAEPFALVTYHPETLKSDNAIASLESIWQALEGRDLPLVFTEANADAAGRAINDWLSARCALSDGRARLVGTLGARGYFSAMRAARLMVGNSSSGIIEAASFGLPVVNIGDRQKGRERSDNTIDVEDSFEAIELGITKALSPDFQAKAAAAINIYGDGKAAERIVDGLKAFFAGGAPVAKQFRLSSSTK
jgi:UDP-hydrolysing UDP-N-acetyl-D-glucosamine 2-epimerase